ncbi:hypothetical protein HMPREF0495_02633 [Levilactobacillus brevis ATCC 14869 = DSM 20054]|uniref:Uncharacterized protein n=1 Tax=Levilactobacillus brevis ATCC 14869 = DSM 20054 TaxID=649758 RepID=U2QPM4_LEVBR|nr:hypothetical protein HMPREF0495_02633 [Levilactobacillus brevis ATCC 14869 = DSM 20054]
MEATSKIPKIAELPNTSKVWYNRRRYCVPHGVSQRTQQSCLRDVIKFRRKYGKL